MLGQQIVGNEDILKQIKKEGHEIGNHSWNHPPLTSLTLESAKKQIEDTQAALEKVLGERPRLMRPPYGDINSSIAQAIDLSVVMWDVDSLDWKNSKTDLILEQVKKQVREGSIILLHDIHPTTVEALPTVLDYLQKNGYHLVSVGELLGAQLENHRIYYRRE